MKAGHGGNLRAISAECGLPVSEILDFSANINPLGPVPALRGALRAAWEELLHYPDPENSALVGAIQKRFGWQRNRIVAGNGASELLHAICRMAGCRRAWIPVPSYSDYAVAAERAGMQVVQVPMEESTGFEVPWHVLDRRIGTGDLVLIGSPNNPTGRIADVGRLQSLVRKQPGALWVVDESFLEFAEGARSIADRLPSRVVMLRSMTKFYAIPGLRLGYAVLNPRMASALRSQLMPWNVNCMAGLAGVVSLADDAYAERTRVAVAGYRRALVQELTAVQSLRVYESAANFVLLRLERRGLDASDLRRRLLRFGIAIRDCANFAGLDKRYFRVAVRGPGERRRLVAALREILGG